MGEFKAFACDGCGLYAPRNELTETKVTREVARESGTVQRFASGRVGYRSGRVTYETERQLLCGECLTKREAAAVQARRARNRRRLAVAFLAIVVLLIVLVALALSSQPPASTSAPNATAATAPPNAVPAAPEAAPTQPPKPVSPAAPETAAAPPQTEQTLQDATLEALATGDTVRWLAGDANGAVTVGAIAEWQGRPCRSYAFSRGDLKSSVGIGCADAAGSWSVEREAHIDGDE